MQKHFSTRTRITQQKQGIPFSSDNPSLIQKS